MVGSPKSRQHLRLYPEDKPGRGAITNPKAMVGENRQLVTNEPVEFEE